MLQKRVHNDRWSRSDSGISLVRTPPQSTPIKFDALPEPVTVDLSAAALLIIDMQNDFLHPQGWFACFRHVDVAALTDITHNINAVSAAFRLHRVPIIHINWAVRQDVANLPANVLDKGSECGTRPAYADEISNGPVLVRDSWGAQTVSQINVDPTDIQVDKHRLTGFRDNALESILRRLGVTTIFYTGMNLDRCVFATLADGCFQGFDAILIEDASSTASPSHIADAVTYLVRMLYGFTTTSTALCGALSSLPSDGDMS